MKAARCHGFGDPDAGRLIPAPAGAAPSPKPTQAGPGKALVLPE
ncbi:hypothetical protein [Actinocorallia populi]|nr:hypothetical protein [Actinocorallia populi]